MAKIVILLHVTIHTARLIGYRKQLGESVCRRATRSKLERLEHRLWIGFLYL